MEVRKTAVQAYLSNYAEPEVQSASALLATNKCDNTFSHVLCLACFNESPDDIERLSLICRENRALLILVINQPDTLASQTIENKSCLNWASQNLRLQNTKQNLSLYQLGPDSCLLVADRSFSSVGLPIPAKQGVGLARKIASDIALSLIASERVLSSWIHCTDADTLLPTDYFAAAHEIDSENTAACVYPFQHVPTAGVSRDLCEATQLYEDRLQNYVSGLHAAGSPYAFHTIGSTLCINAKYLAIARGFPKRAGGEDFYLMNKLAKVGAIKTLDKPYLKIKIRLSERVPFGTGPAVKKLISSSADNCADLAEQKQFYHPALFVILAKILAGFKPLSNELVTIDKTTTDWQSVLRLNASTSHDKDSDNALESISITHLESAIETLALQGFDRCVEHCRNQCRNEQQALKHLHEWLDAFRTLRFLHQLRSKHTSLSNLNLVELQIFKNGRDAGLSIR